MNPFARSTVPSSPLSAAVVTPWIVVLFGVSGCAALVCELVWLHLLQLSIGSSAISLAVLLASFMGGMCLGSLLLPRWVAADRHPLLVYATLELGLVVCGGFVLWGAPAIGGLYDRLGLAGYPGIVGRGIVAAICLLPPTMLMGATLPAVARWTRSQPAGDAWLGRCYAANLTGGVAGCLLAAFWLLPRFDAGAVATFAMVMNLAVAGGAAWLARRTDYRAAADDVVAGFAVPGDIALAIAVSGATALAAEVIWTRLLSLLCGGSVYTFALILAVFLAGLGGGAWLGAGWSRGTTRPRQALGWCQLLVAGGIAWAAWQIHGSLPFWPVDPLLASQPRFTFQLDLVRCGWAVLPATLFWGASFPLAIAAAQESGHDSGQVVGGVAAANTLGAICGALAANALLVWWLGSQRAQQLLIVTSAAAAAGLLVAPAWRASRGGRRLPLVGCIAALAAAFSLAAAVPPVPAALVAYGRHAARLADRADITYVGEGLQASVAVSRMPAGTLRYHNAGKVQASSDRRDMRLQRMLGHLTTLIPPAAQRVLVIGCGAGVTAGAVSIDPVVADETIVEIEPLVPLSVAEHFAAHNEHVLANPKVRVRIDDARHHLLTTDDTYDAITSDPLDPWVKGAAALYTVEFLRTVRARLAPHGVFTMFVQLYESSEAAVKSEVATFFEVFPHGMVFANAADGRGYDLVLLGQADPTRIDLDALETRLARPDMERVARSLREVGISSGIDLCGTFAGQAEDLREWLRDAVLNRDANLRLQYLAGLGLNDYRSEEIFSAMMDHPFRFPADVFQGSERRLRQLRETLVRLRGDSTADAAASIPATGAGVSRGGTLGPQPAERPMTAERATAWPTNRAAVLRQTN
jgi:spermidine synthase